MYRPTEDINHLCQNRNGRKYNIRHYGGRVAEKLILNDISTGASNDIERATKIARSMVTKYGMSEEVGAIMLGSSAGRRSVLRKRFCTKQKNIQKKQQV